MPDGGGQESGGADSSQARTQTGGYVHIAHRNSPSELTPLIQQNLALQQQVEMLQAQNQQMLAQQQLMGPPPVFVPQMMPMYSPYGSPSTPGSSTSGSGHSRTKSYQGHSRRHSLAVGEARRAAHAEQQRRESPQRTGRSGDAVPEIQVDSPALEATQGFRFPPAPRSESPRRSQGRTPSPVRTHHRAGSHAHRRSGSRNFDQNWRQPPLAAEEQAPPSWLGHRSRGSFGSVSSISAFTEQSVQQGGRKSLFVPYLAQAAVTQLVAEGQLVVGTLRVNHKNRSDAYVTTDVLDADIFICGSKDRNRALEGDVVAVELLDVNEVWDSKREKEEKKRRREQENDDARLIETPGGVLRRKGSLKQRPPQKRSDDVEVEGQTLLLREEEPLTDEARPLYAGHVVAIMERPAGQLFSGTLGLLRPSSQATKERQQQERAEKGEPPLSDQQRNNDRPKIVWFKPTNKCVPLMAIPTDQAPKDIVENAEKYIDRIFVAQVKRWPITSLHPFGTLVEELGPGDEPDVQRTAILRDNNFNAHRFSEGAADEASEAANLQQEQQAGRVELKAIQLSRQLGYFVSDDKSLLQISVVDVTPYIRVGGLLDREIRHKSAAVSMDSGFDAPLLPDEFASTLGFAKGRTSPALTVEYAFEDGKLVDTKLFASSVLMEEGEITDDLRHAANRLRDSRGGARLDIDALLEICEPARPPLSDASDDQYCIAELVHQTNAIVAAKLLARTGNAALIRCQNEPAITSLEALANRLRASNVAVDTTSAATLAASIASLKKPKSTAFKAQIAKILSPQRYMPARRAKPLQLGHWWYGFPAYTHFCAPLTRYADHIVHRQVHAVLQGLIPDSTNLEHMAAELTFRHDCARQAQEQSFHLQLSKSLAGEATAAGGFVLKRGIVVQVYESAFDVVIPELSVEKRVHGDQLPLVKAEYRPKEEILELWWERDADVATYTPSNAPAPLTKTGTAELISNSEFNVLDVLKKQTLREADAVQEIKPLLEVPILVRADFGVRVLPSITVRTINPFGPY